MKITLMGVLGFVSAVALLVYAGYALHRMSQEKKKSQGNSNPPLNP